MKNGLPFQASRFNPIKSSGETRSAIPTQLLPRWLSRFVAPTRGRGTLYARATAALGVNLSWPSLPRHDLGLRTAHELRGPKKPKARWLERASDCLFGRNKLCFRALQLAPKYCYLTPGETLNARIIQRIFISIFFCSLTRISTSEPSRDPRFNESINGRRFLRR